MTRITKKFRDKIDDFTREMVVNVAKSFDGRMKIKDKQEKKKAEYSLFPILN